MKVKLHVDRLVLENVAAGGRDAIAGALESELQRLVLDRGAPAALRRAQSVGLMQETCAPRADATSREVGESAAEAIHRGLSR
jgi:hypothetical protein